MANAEAEGADQASQAQTDHGHTGKYTILMELGSGGSATVSAALSKGIAGFSKVVVLKTIREGLSQDEATIRMFLGEARLSARMNHPNVVQVYEVYKQSNLPVIVMEYLDGQSLATLLTRCGSSADLTPELGIAILAKTLAGLHYAHTLTDYSGEPLHLVHRDVSPHNVMIGYDGQVKLVDFGIAKLKNQSVQTRTGVIKGKLSYMAPEQVHGQTDHRSDIFAVGVMLWEMVGRRRLWGDAGDATIIGRLLTGNIPHVSTASPDIDPELERICSKALAVDPEQRYARASDMQSDLEAFIRRSSVDTSQEAIGRLLDRACRDLRERTKAALQQKVMALGTSATGEFDPDEGNEVIRSAVIHTGGTKRRGAWLAAAGVLTAALLVGVATSRRAPTAPEVAADAPRVVVAGEAPSPAEAAPARWAARPERVRLKVSVTPQDAQLYLDGRRLSSNPFLDTLPSDALDHVFRAEANGFDAFTKTIRLESDLDITISMKSVKSVAKPEAAPRNRPRAVAAAPRAQSSARPVVEAAALAKDTKEAPPTPPTAEPAAEPAPKLAAPGENLRTTGGPEDRARGRIQFEDPYAKK